jgi:hypothetical protein
VALDPLLLDAGDRQPKGPVGVGDVHVLGGVDAGQFRSYRVALRVEFVLDADDRIGEREPGQVGPVERDERSRIPTGLACPVVLRNSTRVRMIFVYGTGTL